MTINLSHDQMKRLCLLLQLRINETTKYMEISKITGLYIQYWENELAKAEAIYKELITAMNANEEN